MNPFFICYDVMKKTPLFFAAGTVVHRLKRDVYHPLTTNHKESKFLAFESFQMHTIGIGNRLAGNYRWRNKPVVHLASIVIEQCLKLNVFESFGPSFTLSVAKIGITVFEATKPTTTCCFTYISLNYSEVLMRSSRRFLRIK